LADMVLSDEEQKEYAEIAGEVRHDLDRVEAGEFDQNDNEQA